ncbi:MAG: cytochrome C [Sulfurimicrobium sp.]
MSRFKMERPRSILRKVPLVFGVLGTVATMFPVDSQALPLFARQTGQNCVACHAGGQFPELTPYGRAFKLTGYTIGDRVKVPLSVMAYASYTNVSDTSKSDNPAGDFAKNRSPVIGGGSVFAGGKITDNIGAFIQWTYDNYAAQDPNSGAWHGHSAMDNVDIRYADRFIDANRDLIFGVSLNNNPSVSDVWNTSAAWMQYVPGAGVPANQFNDAATPYPGNSSGGNVAGVTAYVYLNKLLYAELGTYRTANGIFSPLSMGLNNAGTTKLQGDNNPYWRLALTHEWGAHNIMVGTSGNIAYLYDDPTITSDPNSVSKITSTGLDAQYQYILDPHTITAQLAYMRQKTNYSANTVAGNVGLGSPFGFVAADGSLLADPNSSDTINTFRAKLSYIFQAKYGGSLAYFNLTGTTNTANQTSGYDPATGLITSDPTGTLGATALSTRVNGNLSGNPATRGFTYEAFWMPVQYARIGVQYTAYSKYNGASDNYDGMGRNASDNNTLFFYVWGAY